MWGWKVENGIMIPIHGGKVAPSEIITICVCGCKTGCGTKICSCSKGGDHCHSGCSCNSVACTNRQYIENSAEDEEDNEVMQEYNSDESEEE